MFHGDNDVFLIKNFLKANFDTKMKSFNSNKS